MDIVYMHAGACSLLPIVVGPAPPWLPGCHAVWQSNAGQCLGCSLPGAGGERAGLP